MALKRITEGKIGLLVPEGEELTRKMSTFYNPEMKFDRNLSEAIISVLKPKKVADCMCASGVRGLRYKSVLPDSEVILNDLNPKAIELSGKNAKENNLEVKLESQDINRFLGNYLFDFIDIDPFGSPIYFLDAAANSIRNNGVVAITATDTAALCGTSPKASLRRYGIKSLRTDFMKELGLRILISSSIKTFSKYDLAYTPIFSYSKRHYFRVFGQVRKGAQKTDSLLEKFDYVSYCQKCGWREIGFLKECQICKGKANIIGPVYLDNFASPPFCMEVLRAWWPSARAFSEKEKIPNHSKLIYTVKKEQGFPFYFDIHRICELNRKKIRPSEELLKDLRGVRTHFEGTGIKSRKSFNEILRLL